MARETSIDLRNQVMYSVYVRNHGEHGTFVDVENDLKRIKELGTDIIWFMPIHPIGVKNKKGSLGCPYSIQDYRKVNPEYGTLENFKRLTEKIHSMGMKCIIDVVYNHTSPDSVLLQSHPEYFYRKENGEFGSKVGDWSDVVDLDYNNKELWNYQIETLKFWAGIVDGFRCDVAPMIPLDFWLEAREEVKKVNSDCIWLAESMDLRFVKFLRDRGASVSTDSEMYQAFDICYEYDVWEYYNKYLKGECSLSNYIQMLNLQEGIYPYNYVKLRCLENHDNLRAKHIIPNQINLNNWTAFTYFQKGTTLIYAGEEALDDKTPSLFEIDKVNWSGLNEDYVDLMKKLYEIKKENIVGNGSYDLVAYDECETVVGSYKKDNSTLVGIFNLNKGMGQVTVDIEDGEYINLLNNQHIIITDKKVNVNVAPAIFKC